MTHHDNYKKLKNRYSLSWILHTVTVPDGHHLGIDLLQLSLDDLSNNVTSLSGQMSQHLEKISLLESVIATINSDLKHQESICMANHSIGIVDESEEHLQTAGGDSLLTRLISLERELFSTRVFMQQTQQAITAMTEKHCLLERELNALLMGAERINSVPATAR